MMHDGDRMLTIRAVEVTCPTDIYISTKRYVCECADDCKCINKGVLHMEEECSAKVASGQENI